MMSAIIDHGPANAGHRDIIETVSAQGGTDHADACPSSVGSTRRTVDSVRSAGRRWRHCLRSPCSVPRASALRARRTPTHGSATVDGSTSDWNLAADKFAEMTDDRTRPSRSTPTSYLRYDCDTETLFALVLGVDGIQFRQDPPENAYIRIDGTGKLVSGQSGNDGTPPDFSWVNGDGQLTDGFEASGKVAPGSHSVRAHVLRPDESKDGYQNVDNIGRSDPLELVARRRPRPRPRRRRVGPARSSRRRRRPPHPTSSVEGFTSKPRVTLPPTATGVGGEPPTRSISVVLLGLGLVIAGALVLLDKPKLAAADAAADPAPDEIGRSDPPADRRFSGVAARSLSLIGLSREPARRSSWPAGGRRRRPSRRRSPGSSFRVVPDGSR